MFKIECLVQDKRLAEVMHLLAGKVVEMEPPVPVRSHPEDDPQPMAPGAYNGRVLEPKADVAAMNALARDFVPAPKAKKSGQQSPKARRPITEFQAAKGSALTVEDICDGIEKLGWRRTSYTYAIMQLIKEKIIRRTGVGEYKVI